MKRVLAAAMLLAVVQSVGAQEEDPALEAEFNGQWITAADLWAERGPDRGTTARRWAALEAAGSWDILDKETAAEAAAQPDWNWPNYIRAKAWRAQGKLEQAAELLEQTGSKSLIAKAELGSILAEMGRAADAVRTWRQLAESFAAKTTVDPWDQLAAGHAARAGGDPHAAARYYELAYRDSLDFLPARLALGELFYEKHQANLAGEEIDNARKLSPNHPDVLVASGKLAVRNRRLTGAKQFADRVLSLRKEDPSAHKILAELDLIAGLYTQAENTLAAVLKRNQWDDQAHSLVAAASYLSGDSTRYHRTLKDMESAKQNSVQAHQTLGAILEVLLRNDEATAQYRQVVEQDPNRASAWSAMGQLAMREGRESEGREYLEKAFELDRFNIRAYNQLELLDFMDTFTEYTFDGFSIKLKAEEDSVIVPLVSKRMTAMRDELTEAFEWTPKNPTVLEFFPTHEWFSARVTGLAWLDGIPGVCFGDIVAMDSPRTLEGVSNWEQILRHEYGHVLALSITNRKVPFWFTEGLSVYLEQHPRGLDWDQNLVGAWWDGDLVGVDSLTIAFTRPKHRRQRLLAYHQSGIIIGDIVARYGWPAIPALLRAFGRDESLEEAVPKVLGVSYAQWTQEALEACGARARSLHLWPSPDSERFQNLQARAESADPVILERLAITAIQLRQTDVARACLDRLGTKSKPRTEGLRAMIEFQEGSRERGLEIAGGALDSGCPDFRVWMQTGIYRLAVQDTAGAKEAFAGALELYPLSHTAMSQLGRIALAENDRETARTMFSRVMQTTDGSGEAAFEIAELELDRGEFAAALEAMEYALGILPLNSRVYAMRGRIKLRMGSETEAYADLMNAKKLNLRNVDWMVGFAEYYMEQEDFEESAYFSRLALKYAPDHELAQNLLARAENEL